MTESPFTRFNRHLPPWMRPKGAKPPGAQAPAAAPAPAAPPSVPKLPALPPQGFQTADDLRVHLRKIRLKEGQGWTTKMNAEEQDFIYELWKQVIENLPPALKHGEAIRIIAEEAVLCSPWSWRLLVESHPPVLRHMEHFERWQGEDIAKAKTTWRNERIRKLFDNTRDMKQHPRSADETEAVLEFFRVPFPGAGDEQETVMTSALSWIAHPARIPNAALPLMARQPVATRRGYIAAGLILALSDTRPWKSNETRAAVASEMLANPKFFQERAVQLLVAGLLTEHPELWWAVLQHRHAWPGRWAEQFHKTVTEAIARAPEQAADAVRDWDTVGGEPMPRDLIRWALSHPDREIRTRAIREMGQHSQGTQEPTDTPSPVESLAEPQTGEPDSPIAPSFTGIATSGESSAETHRGAPPRRR